jgi:spore coat-associated protein N
MKSIRVSRLLSLAAIGAVAAVCAGSGLAQPAKPAQAVLTDATGDLHLATSREGQAIFQASGLAPGRSVTGTVQLLNSGSLPGDLSLQQLDVRDQPGAGGGRLSNAVTLNITDVTAGNSIPIFAGRLGGLGSRQLGAIGPSEARTFRFTASLPDGGLPSGPTAGDNAYAGSGLTVRYAWTATSTGTGTGLTPSQTPPTVDFRVNKRRLLKRGWLDVFARCNRGCTLTVSAKAPRKTHVRIRRRVVTLPVPDRTARIRLKLNRRSRHALQRALRKRKRVVIRVNVKLVAAGWTEVTSHQKKVSVKRRAVGRRR